MSEMEQWLDTGRDRTFPARGLRETTPDWMAYALRFCRDGEDILSARMKVVPADHHLTGTEIECVCESVTEVPDRGFVECPGDCGRWFMRDGDTVWAARLPHDDS